jgi:predicted chitinase
VANPELLGSDIRYGIESAFFFWDFRNINAIADTDDVTKVTLAVNGGSNGLQDRQARLQRIKLALHV